MAPTPIAVIATLAMTLSLAGPVSSVSAADAVVPVASDGEIVDVMPTTATLNAMQRHSDFFKVEFTTMAGDKRYVATELVVHDAKKTAPSELFLGVTLTCASPSGKQMQAEGGRNVWPAGSDFSIPVGMMHEADVDGTYTCTASVMMCDPGNCTAPTGKGIVSIVTRAMDPKVYSFLYVSVTLPAWSQSERVPQSGDQLVPAGTAQTLSWGFDVSGGSDKPVRVGGLISVTNCIEKSYPVACAKAKKVSARGAASIKLTLTATQQPTQAGVTCARATAQRADGARTYRISWQQHHAVFAVAIPNFVLMDKPGCGTTVNVVGTLTVGKGNSIAIESGSKRKWSSTLYAIPGDTLTSTR